ncbi:MAG: DUF2605 domain-containing protein [Leptolyngbya sp. SIO1E4]|nr:DUF2605 domain-containing protein [Leptolyngbya sp. SIO1E4]
MFSSEPSNTPDQPLVKALLEPLLDDFQYWFSEANTLLTSPKADCLATEQRHGLLEKIGVAQQEVATARTLLMATDGQAGVDTAMLRNWHQLVSICWQTAQKVRKHNRSAQPGEDAQ